MMRRLLIIVISLSLIQCSDEGHIGDPLKPNAYTLQEIEVFTPYVYMTLMTSEDEFQETQKAIWLLSFSENYCGDKNELISTHKDMIKLLLVTESMEPESKASFIIGHQNELDNILSGNVYVKVEELNLNNSNVAAIDNGSLEITTSAEQHHFHYTFMLESGETVIGRYRGILKVLE